MIRLPHPGEDDPLRALTIYLRRIDSVQAVGIVWFLESWAVSDPKERPTNTSALVW